MNLLRCQKTSEPFSPLSIIFGALFSRSCIRPEVHRTVHKNSFFAPVKIKEILLKERPMSESLCYFLSVFRCFDASFRGFGDTGNWWDSSIFIVSSDNYGFHANLPGEQVNQFCRSLDSWSNGMPRMLKAHDHSKQRVFTLERIDACHKCVG